MHVAVIILTFNEEANLPAALDSVRGWASEVFVVDSFSTDRTVDIALARAGDGVHVVQHAFEDYSKQWNWALAKLPIRSAWTLKLDADERATDAFRKEVDRITADAPPDLEGVYFRRLFHFMGTPLYWGGVSSAYVMHLWRTGKAVFEDRAVNEHALVQGKTQKIGSFIEHHDFKSLADWIDKHNRYSSIEARCFIEGNVTGEVPPRIFGTADERRMWWRRAFWAMPCRTLLYFLYRYLGRLGCLDGTAGLRYCYLHAAYRYWTTLKVAEHHLRGVMPEVEWPARGQPHPDVVRSSLQQVVDYCCQHVDIA